MKFTYSGYTSAGKAASGQVEATDARDAAEAVRRKGIFPTAISEEGAARPGGAVEPAVGGGASHVRLKDVAAFMREMSILVSTGTPVADAITSLESQTPPGAWRTVLTDVRTRVEQGEQLSEAMAKHPRAFDPVCRSLIAAGEQGGRMDELLDRLSRLLRQQIKVRSALIGASVYPCLLITIATIVLVAMIGFVMPRFESLFKTLQAPLPPTTRVLMDIGQFARDQWYTVLGACACVVVGVVLWAKSSSGRRAIDTALVFAPQVGRVTRSFATARLARLLGVLLDGRVPLLDAIKLARLSTGNSLYAELIDQAEAVVTKGESFSAALSNRRLIAPSVVEAVRNAERSGRLAEVFCSIADHMDEDNEVLLRTLTHLIEPVILIVMGVVVGTVAISMFLPLFDLTSASGGGGGG